MVKLSDVTRFLPDVAGVAALGLIVAGVWGLLGWEWAAISAGLPPGAFYLWGEVRQTLARENRRSG